jgi:hypothetical protein
MDLIGKRDCAREHSQTEEAAWDRQPRETSKAYRAFCLYRDAHEVRTFEYVAGMLQCSGANIRRWAKKWNWVDRARAFDIYIDRIEREALAHERLAMKKRMARQGIDMQVVAAAGLAELQRLVNDKGATFRLTASDIARLADVGGKLERYARSENEEYHGIFEVRVRVDDPPPERTEDLIAAKAAIEAALRGK